MSHPSWKCFILCLCRRNDKDRAPRFYQAMQILRSDGNMGNLDDGPDQLPLIGEKVQQAILDLLPTKQFDLIISHNPSGEYTRHIRHEEVSKAVIDLWHANKISTEELWTFAYEDGNKTYLPRPVQNASIHQLLTKPLQIKKYKIITDTYGFAKSSWEAKTTPNEETFWQFSNAKQAKKWLDYGGILI